MDNPARCACSRAAPSCWTMLAATGGAILPERAMNVSSGSPAAHSSARYWTPSLTEVKGAHYVRMHHAGAELGFPKEALYGDRVGRQPRSQDLESHRSTLGVVRQIDLGGAALAYCLVDRVAGYCAPDQRILCHWDAQKYRPPRRDGKRKREPPSVRHIIKPWLLPEALPHAARALLLFAPRPSSAAAGIGPGSGEVSAAEPAGRSGSDVRSATLYTRLGRFVSTGRCHYIGSVAFVPGHGDSTLAIIGISLANRVFSFQKARRSVRCALSGGVSIRSRRMPPIDRRPQRSHPRLLLPRDPPER